MKKGPLVSVVDDDPSVREALRSLLRSVGYRVAIFTSAEAFLKSAHLEETACLILDMRMPGMTGLELLRRLQTDGRRVPCVAITAVDDDPTRKEVLKAGALAFLTKPFQDETILKWVRSSAPQ